MYPRANQSPQSISQERGGCRTPHGHNQTRAIFVMFSIFPTCGGRQSTKRPLATVPSVLLDLRLSQVEEKNNCNY